MSFTDVFVLNTSLDARLAAARVGGELARALDRPLTLVRFRPLPRWYESRREPSGQPDICIGRLRAEGLDINVREFVTNDERQALPFVFRPGSLILIGGRRRWWPDQVARWQRLLEAAGHFVVFVNAQESAHA